MSVIIMLFFQGLFSNPFPYTVSVLSKICRPDFPGPGRGAEGVWQNNTEHGAEAAVNSVAHTIYAQKYGHATGRAIISWIVYIYF